MQIQISHREVINNILRFKDNVLEIRGERPYRALLNRKTGDLQFALQAPYRKSFFEDWQEIQIDVERGPEREIHFEVRDSHHKPLQLSGLEPLAWRVLNETLEALNHIASQHRGEIAGRLPEEAALQDLSDIHLSTFHEPIEEMRGWKGSIDRFAAEAGLQGRGVGTYILRNGDPLARMIAARLADSNKITIEPYLWTRVEEEEKIADILILHTSRGWTLYRDNPDLSDSEYVYVSSARAALALRSENSSRVSR